MESPNSTENRKSGTHCSIDGDLLKAEDARPDPVLEHERHEAVGRAHAQQVHGDRGGRHDHRAEGQHEQHEAERQDHGDDPGEVRVDDVDVVDVEGGVAGHVDLGAGCRRTPAGCRCRAAPAPWRGPDRWSTSRRSAPRAASGRRPCRSAPAPARRPDRRPASRAAARRRPAPAARPPARRSRSAWGSPDRPRTGWPSTSNALLGLEAVGQGVHARDAGLHAEQGRGDQRA